MVSQYRGVLTELALQLNSKHQFRLSVKRRFRVFCEIVKDSRYIYYKNSSEPLHCARNGARNTPLGLLSIYLNLWRSTFTIEPLGIPIFILPRSEFGAKVISQLLCDKKKQKLLSWILGSVLTTAYADNMQFVMHVRSQTCSENSVL